MNICKLNLIMVSFLWGDTIMRKILVNRVRCNRCGDVITSEYRHDYKSCRCGRVAVDGGTDYLRRGFTDSTDDYTELSEYEETTDSD